jgi:hypothetical protein
MANDPGTFLPPTPFTDSVEWAYVVTAICFPPRRNDRLKVGPRVSSVLLDIRSLFKPFAEGFSRCFGALMSGLTHTGPDPWLALAVHVRACQDAGWVLLVVEPLTLDAEA